MHRIKRLEAVERRKKPKPKVRAWPMVIGEFGDTQGDLDAKRDRMIAQGEALPDDNFIYIFIV
jgi:hypothetical protein